MCGEKSKSVSDAHTFEGGTFDRFTLSQQEHRIRNGFTFRIKPKYIN